MKGKPIKNMKIGEEGFVAPWQLRYDQNGRPWMFGETTVMEKQHGTATLPVSKTPDSITTWSRKGPVKPDIR